MKENTSNKKRVIYYVILGVCALLLIAGIVLTVYFVTQGSGTPIVDAPPVEEPDDPKEPSGPSIPDDPTPPDDEKKEPSKPSGGEDVVQFVPPIDYEDYAVVFAEIYENETLGWWYRHMAVDFAAPAGTEVRSMAAGTVELVSNSPEVGNLIVVNHGDGLKTLYRFVEAADGIEVGTKVAKGQKIGAVAEAYGSEAFAGEHLHLAIMLNDKYVDPTDYLEPVLDEK